MNANPEDALRSRLDAGAHALGLSLNAQAADQLLALLQLLARWNTAYNLTAVADPNEALVKHVLDSLSALGQVRGPRVLDVGTGAGFPGLPLAIMRPDWQLTLLDSHRKKLRFIDQAAAELGLTNVRTVHSRIEAFQPEVLFDTVVCRALTELRQFVTWAAHLIDGGGQLLAMKARLAPAEVEAIPDGWHHQQEPVVVPFLDGRRTLVVVRPDPDAPIPGAET